MAFTQVTVTRDYDLANGVDPYGTVSFTPSAWLVNGATVPAATVTTPLGVGGKISVALFANTDLATLPAGSYYTVREDVAGQPRRSYRVIVPHNVGSPLDLTALAEAYPSVFTGLTGYGLSGYGTSGYGD